jgi:hypothetical protein
MCLAVFDMIFSPLPFAAYFAAHFAIDLNCKKENHAQRARNIENSNESLMKYFFLQSLAVDSYS